MEFKVGVGGIYRCTGLRSELPVRVHNISCMMRVVVTDGFVVRIANIRHGIWIELGWLVCFQVWRFNEI